jgi:hypothetical protein
LIISELKNKDKLMALVKPVLKSILGHEHMYQLASIVSNAGLTAMLLHGCQKEVNSRLLILY